MLFYRLKKEFWEAFGVRERLPAGLQWWVLHNINLIAVKSAMYADGRSRTSIWMGPDRSVWFCTDTKKQQRVIMIPTYPLGRVKTLAITIKLRC